MKDAKTLQRIRINQNLSHKEVAEKAQISRVFYTQIENGNRTPSMKVAKRLADAFGLSLDDFFYALQVTKCNRNKTETA